MAAVPYTSLQSLAGHRLCYLIATHYLSLLLDCYTLPDTFKATNMHQLLMYLLCLQPTQQLQRFFRACDYDMTDLVAARIDQMSQAVFPVVSTSEHAVQALQAAMNNERRQQVSPPLTTLYAYIFHVCILSCSVVPWSTGSWSSPGMCTM